MPCSAPGCCARANGGFGRKTNPSGSAAGELLKVEGVQSTFTHKFLMMVFAGFAAACLFWAFRHIVQEAFYETSNDGWRDSLKGGTAEKRAPR